MKKTKDMTEKQVVINAVKILDRLDSCHPALVQRFLIDIGLSEVEFEQTIDGMDKIRVKNRNKK